MAGSNGLLGQFSILYRKKPSCDPVSATHSEEISKEMQTESNHCYQTAPDLGTMTESRLAYWQMSNLYSVVN